MTMNKAIIQFLLVVGLFSTTAFGQIQKKHPGVLLFDEGKFEQAASVLEKAKDEEQYKNDAEILNYLGSSYVNLDNYNKAKKPFENAVKLRPDNPIYRNNLAFVYLRTRQINKAQSESEKVIRADPKNTTAYLLLCTADLWEGKFDSAAKYADKAIELEPTQPMGYVLAAEVLTARFGSKVNGENPKPETVGILEQAKRVLETGIAKCGPVKRLQQELETVTVFHNYFLRDRSIAAPVTPAEPKPGEVNLKILVKPRVSYTDSARLANVSGAISVAVLFGASGQIEATLLLKGLGYGLDQQAFMAARQIKFEPQQENGKPVSVVRMIEYSFEIR